MSPRTGPEQAGFTLMELVVAMGILAGFLVMLVQLLNSGVDLVEEGESGQLLTDRAQVAAREVTEALETLRGPAPGVAPREPEARLWVQWVPPGLVGDDEPTGERDFVPRVQALRSSVDLDPEVEERLREPELAIRAELEVGELGEQAVAARLAELRAETPLLGHGSMWLLPWPAGDPDGAYLELRRALFTPAARLEPEEGELVDPLHVPYLGAPDVPPALAHAVSETFVRDLLHVEFRLWSQYSESWDRRIGSGGPELAWDSARAGWLTDTPPLGFSMDLHPGSLRDTTDDVYPHWIQVTLVVGTGVDTPPETLLAEDLAADSRELRVVNPDRLPEAEQGFVKVGPEWIHYGEIDGYELRGLRRGQRGTEAAAHRAGVGVRAGRTVVFQVRVPHGKENWNG